MIKTGFRSIGLSLLAIILLAIITWVQLLIEEYHDQPLCFVNPKQLEDKTRSQTSHQVLLDLKLECMDMTQVRLRKCKIPNILHSVIVGGSFKFHHYLSLKSIHTRIRPDKIFLHGYNFPFDSLYFNQSIQEFNIELVTSRNVTQVFDRPVDRPEHKSDVIRLESLIRFGGMYFDFDVYALKDIDELLKGSHEFIIAPENNYGLNNGIMMSKRCATFPLLWYEEYRNFDGHYWNELSIRKPKQLYEKLWGTYNLNGVHVDRSLSSNWGSGIFFKSLNDTPQSFWRDTRLVHAFWRDHGIEYNQTSIQKLNTTLGRFARDLFNELRDIFPKTNLWSGNQSLTES